MPAFPQPDHGPKSKAASKLAASAQAAAEVRAYQTHPDVVAYKIERTNTWTMRLIWIGLILGLAFTAVNVQQFASQGATTEDLAWWTAWLLDPMVSLILIGVLIGEQNIARHNIASTRWIRATKWAALAATYSMNTWSSWAAGHADDIVLHSVPPLMVVFAAEAVTDLRHLVTRAVASAHSAALTRAEVFTVSVPESAPPIRTEALKETRTESLPAGGRTDDDPRQVDDAPVQSEEAATPRAPEVDRSAVVADLASQILTAMADGRKWSPDYPELMARTDRRRSWCEKAVREARQLALSTGQPEDDHPSRTEPRPYSPDEAPAAEPVPALAGSAS